MVQKDPSFPLLSSSPTEWLKRGAAIALCLHRLALPGCHSMDGFAPKPKSAMETAALPGLETSRMTSCLNVSIDLPCVPADKLICFTQFSVLIDFVEV